MGGNVIWLPVMLQDWMKGCWGGRFLNLLVMPVCPRLPSTLPSCAINHQALAQVSAADTRNLGGHSGREEAGGGGHPLPCHLGVQVGPFLCLHQS